MVGKLVGLVGKSLQSSAFDLELTCTTVVPSIGKCEVKKVEVAE